VYPDHSDNLDNLIELADHKMYEDKRSHKALKLTGDVSDDQRPMGNRTHPNGPIAHSPTSA
jgi:hypothetical protein